MQEPNPLLFKQIEFLSKAAQSNDIAEADITGYLKKANGNHTEALYKMLRDNGMEFDQDQQQAVHKEYGLKVIDADYIKLNRLSDEEAADLEKEGNELFESINSKGVALEKGVGLGSRDYDPRFLKELADKKKIQDSKRLADINNRLANNDELATLMPGVKKFKENKLGQRSLDGVKEEITQRTTSPWIVGDNPFGEGGKKEYVDKNKVMATDLQRGLDADLTRKDRVITAQDAILSKKAEGKDRIEADVQARGLLSDNMASLSRKRDMLIEDFKNTKSGVALEKIRSVTAHMEAQAKEIAKGYSIGEALGSYAEIKQKEIDLDALNKEVPDGQNGYVTARGMPGTAEINAVAKATWRQVKHGFNKMAYAVDDLIGRDSYEEFLRKELKRGKEAAAAIMPAAYRGSPLDRYVDVDGQKFLVDQYGKIQSAIDEKWVETPVTEEIESKANKYQESPEKYKINSGLDGHLNLKKLIGSNLTVGAYMVPIITSSAAMSVIPGGQGFVVKNLAGIVNYGLSMFHDNLQEQIKHGKGYDYAFKTALMNTTVQSLIGNLGALETKMGQQLGKGVKQAFQKDLEGFITKDLNVRAFYQKALPYVDDFTLETFGETGEMYSGALFDHFRNGMDINIDPDFYANTVLSMSWTVPTLKAMTDMSASSGEAQRYKNGYLRAMKHADGAGEVITAMETDGKITKKEADIKRNRINASKAEFDEILGDNGVTKSQKRVLLDLLVQRDFNHMRSDNIALGPGKERYAAKAEEINKKLYENWNRDKQDVPVLNSDLDEITNDDLEPPAPPPGAAEPEVPEPEVVPAEESVPETPEAVENPAEVIEATPEAVETPVTPVVVPAPVVTPTPAEPPKKADPIKATLGNKTYEKRGDTWRDANFKPIKDKDKVAQLERKLLPEVEVTAGGKKFKRFEGDWYDDKNKVVKNPLNIKRLEKALVDPEPVVGPEITVSQARADLETAQQNLASAEKKVEARKIKQGDVFNDGSAQGNLFDTEGTATESIEALKAAAKTAQEVYDRVVSGKPAVKEKPKVEPKKKPEPPKKPEPKKPEAKAEPEKKIRASAYILINGKTIREDLVAPDLRKLSDEDIKKQYIDGKLSAKEALGILQAKNGRKYYDKELNDAAAHEKIPQIKNEKKEEEQPKTPTQKELIAKRAKEVSISEREKIKNDLVEVIRKYNGLAKGQMGKNKPAGLQMANTIKLKAAENGYEAKVNRSGNLELYKDGKKVAMTVNRKEEGGKSLVDGSPEKALLASKGKEVKDLFKKIYDGKLSSLFFEYEGTRLSFKQIESILDDIHNGIPSRYAEEFLAFLEASIRDGFVPLYDSVIGVKTIPIKDFMDHAVDSKDSKDEVGSAPELPEKKSFIAKDEKGNPIDADAFELKKMGKVSFAKLILNGLYKGIKGIRGFLPSESLFLNQGEHYGRVNLLGDYYFIDAFTYGSKKSVEEQRATGISGVAANNTAKAYGFESASDLAEAVKAQARAERESGADIVMDFRKAAVKEISDSQVPFQAGGRKPLTIDIKTFKELLDKLNQAIGDRMGGVLTGDAFEAAVKEKAGRKILDARKEIYGFVGLDGKVYLNGDKINANTPVHEYGHIWISSMKDVRPDIYNKGLSLVDGSFYVDELLKNPYYKVAADQYGKGNKTALLEEALAQAIGDKGEMIVNAAERATFKDWLTNFWNDVKRFFGGKITDLSAERVSNLNLFEFVELVAGQLVAGEKVETAIPLIKDKDGNLLAPNGKKSNLNETQWRLVRTPAFKNWFGDWETVEGKRYIHQSSKKAINKIKNEGFNTNVVWLAPDDNASYGDTSVEVFVPPFKKPFILDDLTANYYGLPKKQIEENRKRYKELGGEANNKTFDTLRNEGYDVIVEDNGDIGYLNPKNLKFDNNDVSKVVDSNGEPLVVYHGTRSPVRFNVFKPLFSTQGSGVFFATNRDYAQKFTESSNGSVYEVFLNIKNPFEATKVSSVFDKYHKKGDDFDLATEKLRKDGHDGVFMEDSKNIGRGTEWFVLDPNQIKLADGTNTTFDPKSNKIDLQIIGERGAESVPEAKKSLQTAREMEQAGKDVKAIRLGTGWERGGDKKWRYELPDVEEVDISTTDMYGKRTLEETVTAKELFEAYPILRNIPIEITSNRTLELKDADAFRINGATYIYSDGKFAIEVGFPDIRDFKGDRIWEKTRELLDKNRDEILGVIAHEIQHVIQRIEGFATGGTPSDFRGPFLSKADTKKTKAVVDFLESSFEIAQKNKSTLKEVASTIINTLDPAERKIVEGILAGFNDAQIKKLIKDNQYAGLSLFEKYRRLAGETEARNVQIRMGLTPEQRRATLLVNTEDVSRDSQIFTYDAKVAYSVGAEKRAKAALEKAQRLLARAQSEVALRQATPMDVFGDVNVQADLFGADKKDIKNILDPLIANVKAAQVEYAKAKEKAQRESDQAMGQQSLFQAIPETRLEKAKDNLSRALEDMKILGAINDPRINAERLRRVIDSVFELAVAQGLKLKDDIVALIKKEVKNFSPYQIRMAADTIHHYIESYNKPELSKKITKVLAEAGLKVDEAIDLLEQTLREPADDKKHPGLGVDRGEILKYLDDLKAKRDYYAKFSKPIEATNRESFLEKLMAMLAQYKDIATEFAQADITGHYAGVDVNILKPNINGSILHAAHFIETQHEVFVGELGGTSTDFILAIAAYINGPGLSQIYTETLTDGVKYFISELKRHGSRYTPAKYYSNLVAEVQKKAAERRSNLGRALAQGTADRNPWLNEKLNAIEGFLEGLEESLSEEDSESDDESNKLRDEVIAILGETPQSRRHKKMDGSTANKVKKKRPTKMDAKVVDEVRKNVKRCK